MKRLGEYLSIFLKLLDGGVAKVWHPVLKLLCWITGLSNFQIARAALLVSAVWTGYLAWLLLDKGHTIVGASILGFATLLPIFETTEFRRFEMSCKQKEASVLPDPRIYGNILQGRTWCVVMSLILMLGINPFLILSISLPYMAPYYFVTDFEGGGKSLPKYLLNALKRLMPDSKLPELGPTAG